MLAERLQQVCVNGKLPSSEAVDADEMGVDSEEPSKMQLDSENGKPENR